MASVTLITSLFFILAVLSVHAKNPQDVEDGPEVPVPTGDMNGDIYDPRDPPGMGPETDDGPGQVLDPDAYIPGDSIPVDSDGDGSSNVGVDSSSGGDEPPPPDVQPAGRPSRNRQ
ncbi:hypothetical protein DdX_10282 [Ditylenchus destructor]|uniref:Uncharacterized protein n=1 Tax=Ditylenchus destructor TaxID=166010 RepID=A0AAD4MYD7_9BILA|nr:hypothetical protein DdX_10282 [Ditylenchus destructor]